MRLCQLEFYSYDVNESLKFGGAILGWKKVPVALQDQAVIEVGADSPYGISIRSRRVLETDTKKAGLSQSGQPALIVYFEVEKSLTAVRELVVELGANIIQEPTAVTGYGIVMIVEDKGGLRYGLYEAKFEGPRARTLPS